VEIITYCSKASPKEKLNLTGIEPFWQSTALTAFSRTIVLLS